MEGTQTFTVPSSAANSTAASVDVRSWNYIIADPKLYLRQQLWKDDKAVISAQGTLKLPSLTQNNDLPRTGSDQFSYEARVLAGHNFNWLEHSQFGNLEVAYEWRPKDEGDLMHIDATLGWNITEKWMILPQIFSTWRFGNSGNRFTQSGNDSYDLVKPQLSVVYQMREQLALQGGLFHHAYARNSGGGSGIILGTWLKH